MIRTALSGLPFHPVNVQPTLEAPRSFGSQTVGSAGVVVVGGGGGGGGDGQNRCRVMNEDGGIIFGRAVAPF